MKLFEGKPTRIRMNAPVHVGGNGGSGFVAISVTGQRVIAWFRDHHPTLELPITDDADTIGIMRELKALR